MPVNFSLDLSVLAVHMAKEKHQSLGMTGFLLFRDLPAEIRLMIWKQALQVPKIFMVQKRRPIQDDRNFDVQVNLKTMLHISRVCREANGVYRDTAQPGIARWQQRVDNRTNGWGDTTEDRLWRTPREMGWSSTLWAYYNPSMDSIYLDADAVEIFDSESAETLKKLVGRIKRIIIPHDKIDDEGTLFLTFWNKLHLESVSLLKAFVSVGEPAGSILSRRLEADLPLVVSIEDPSSIRAVENTLGQNSYLLNYWKETLAWYDQKGVGIIHGYVCNWVEFKNSIQADWLYRVSEWCPFPLEDGEKPPVDEDGLILNYRHPWVKRWAPTIPRFEAVVMFITSQQESRPHS